MEKMCAGRGRVEYVMMGKVRVTYIQVSDREYIVTQDRVG